MAFLLSVLYLLPLRYKSHPQLQPLCLPPSIHVPYLLSTSVIHRSSLYACHHPCTSHLSWFDVAELSQRQTLDFAFLDVRLMLLYQDDDTHEDNLARECCCYCWKAGRWASSYQMAVLESICSRNWPNDVYLVSSGMSHRKDTSSRFQIIIS